MIKHEVLDAIAKEFIYQDNKWGTNKQQSLIGYLTIVKKEVEEAIEGWNKNLVDRHSPLNELVQAVTVGIRCLNEYGVNGITINVNDIRNDRAIDCDQNQREVDEIIPFEIWSSMHRRMITINLNDVDYVTRDCSSCSVVHFNPSKKFQGHLTHLYVAEPYELLSERYRNLVKLAQIDKK